MNPNHDKEGKFTTSNGGGLGSKLNKMGFGPDRKGQNWVKDEQGNYFYEFGSEIENPADFIKWLEIPMTDEDWQEFQEYGTISAEKFDDYIGDEDYLEEAYKDFSGYEEPMDEFEQRDNYLSNRADELNDEEKLNG